MPYIEGPHCRLWTEIIGTGDPVTVFAHGITGSGAEMIGLHEKTSGTRILMDFRGHGKSEAPDIESGYDHPIMRQDLEAVADHYSATQVFAMSMGAGALNNLLVDKPDRFRRIVFFNPASLDGPNEGVGDLFYLLANDLETIPLPELAEQQANMENPLYVGRHYWRQKVRERVLRMNSVGIPRALRAYSTGKPPVEDADMLRSVVAPALIIAQHGDPIHDIEVGRRLSRILPNARIAEWDEPLSMYDDMEALASLIGEFFAGAGEGS